AGKLLEDFWLRHLARFQCRSYRGLLGWSETSYTHQLTLLIQPHAAFTVPETHRQWRTLRAFIALRAGSGAAIGHFSPCILLGGSRRYLPPSVPLPRLIGFASEAPHRPR